MSSAADVHPVINRDRAWTLAIGGLTLVAALLRFWHLGDWSLSGDESFTLTFSTDQFTWRDLRPLAFALNHYIAVPLFGANEFALRFFPAVFGVLAVPVMAYLVGRCYGKDAGFFTALLITFSPGLIGHSQFARYYMQSFALAGVVPFATLLGFRTHQHAWFVVGAVALLAGWFMVPSSSFVLPGLAVWVLLAARDLLSDTAMAWLWRHRFWLIAGAVLLFLVAAAGSLAIRSAYMVADLANGLRYSSPVQVVFGTLAVLTLPVALLACAGLVFAARDDRLLRPEKLLLPCWAIGAAATFVAAWPLIHIGAPHVLSVLAVAYAAAGLVLAHVWRAARSHLVAGAAIASLLLPTSRDLVSYYADGNRLDFRGAAARLRQLDRSAPGPVYALGHANLSYYAPELDLREFLAVPDSLAWLDDPSRTRPVRIVLSEHRRGLDLPETDPAVQRVLAACPLRERLTRPRMDYYLNALRIYECPASSQAAGTRSAPDSASGVR